MSVGYSKAVTSKSTACSKHSLRRQSFRKHGPPSRRPTAAFVSSTIACIREGSTITAVCSGRYSSHGFGACHKPDYFTESLNHFAGVSVPIGGFLGHRFRNDIGAKSRNAWNDVAWIGWRLLNMSRHNRDQVLASEKGGCPVRSVYSVPPNCTRPIASTPSP